MLLTDATTLASEHPSVIAKFLGDLASQLKAPLENVTEYLDFNTKVTLTKIAGP